jgi:hypothetical protein
LGKRFKIGVSKKRGRNSDDDDSDYVPSGSEAASSYNPPDQDVEDEDDEINIATYTGPIKKWTAREYTKARTVDAYSFANDATLPHFHTQVQQDAFFSVMAPNTVFKHKYIDWQWMRQFPLTNDVVSKFHHLQLINFCQHKCDWNETIIQQFYATVEIDFEGTKIHWMTGTRRYEAFFEEFATVNQLDYNVMANAADQWDEPYLDQNEWQTYYLDNASARNYGTVKNLKPQVAFVNKILRSTIYPKGGNNDVIRELHWNLIDCIMQGKPFNVVRLMLKYIEELSAKLGGCLVLCSLHHVSYSEQDKISQETLQNWAPSFQAIWIQT